MSAADILLSIKQLAQSLMNQPLYPAGYKVIETKGDIAIVDVFFPPEAGATFSKITCDHLIAHARYSVSDIRERQDRWQNDLCSVTVGCAVNYPEAFSETIEYEPHRFLKNGTLTDASLIAIKNFADGKTVTLKFHSKHFRPFQRLTLCCRTASGSMP